jgi:hypothetical protein
MVQLQSPRNKLRGHSTEKLPSATNQYFGIAWVTTPFRHIKPSVQG